MTWQLRNNDLRFILETVAPHVDLDSMPEVSDAWLEEALENDELFERIVGQPQLLTQISPWLFFNILLRRARRDLTNEAFTMERRARQKVVVFDTEEVSKLLEEESVLDYLSSMLSSFTRVASMTVRVNIGRGVWRRYRTNDLDVEGLIRYAEAVDEAYRFEPYKRIGDVCLFMTGMFPEFIDARYRYAASRQIRPGMKGRVVQSREDYEHYGRAFYELAAEHERAEVGGLNEVLTKLSEHFLLAEKPLGFLANRYLWGSRHELFGM